jgi:hypothetical protein
MRPFLKLLAFLIVTLIPASAVAKDLSAAESETLVFMREEEKLARDVYLDMNALWGLKLFGNISESEQRHMDAMLKMIDLYGLEDPVGDNPPGTFANPSITQRFDEAVSQGTVSLADALHVGGEIEEIDMIDLAAAIAATDEDPLKRSYSNLLSASCNHLRTFVTHLVRLEGVYEPKRLDDQVFSECVGDLETVPVGNGEFSINAGLNDMWYYPGTAGQGFSVTVYPGPKKVFLIWFTFDVLPPEPGMPAIIGAPGQRWLAAEGPYEGANAELALFSMRGGLFDDPAAPPELLFDGRVRLRFENCDSGVVEFDIPSAGLAGEIPIQRVNADNVARCLQEAQGADSAAAE